MDLRGGKTRVGTTACDHDPATQTVTPDGTFVPQPAELLMYLVSTTLTRDGMVEIRKEWWQIFRHRVPKVRTLVINQDHGPENNASRTQFRKRIVEFAQTNQVEVQLADYPPSHRKYNPIERVWATLERHWNGSLLEVLETAVAVAKTRRCPRKASHR